MATKMRSHNVEQFNKQPRAQGRVSQVPPQGNVVAAASHIRQLFESKKITYGIMGGLEMLCLGHRREIPDVHIVYDDKEFNRIKSKLEKDSRVQLPEGMNSLLPSIILVRTGPSYHDIGCTNPAAIEVSLVPSGSYGTPPNGTLSNNLVLLSLKTGGVLKTYKGLNMLYLVQTLVHYCKARDLAWDPRKDLVFLCQHYGAEVHTIHGQLNQGMIQQNFLVTAFFIRLPFAVQRICYQALLGQEPPPIMAVTPATLQDGHLRSQSASEFARPRKSYQNTPSGLKTQRSPEFISPSPPVKSSTNMGSQPGKLYTPSTSLTNLTPTTNDSRSRYRVVSAPHSRRNSPEPPRSENTPNARSQDMRYITQQQQAPRPLHSAQTFHPQQSETGTRNRANSNVVQPAKNPRTSTVLTSSKGNAVKSTTKGSSLWQPPQRQYEASSVEAQPTHNPGQLHSKSQFGLRSSVVAEQTHVLSTPIIRKPIPPQPRRVHQSLQPSRLANTGTSTPEQQSSIPHLGSSEGGNVQHITEAEETARRLRLVGPEGLYQPPQKPKPVQSTLKTASVSTSPYELDAAPLETKIITSLSADITAAIKTSSAGQTPVQPSWYNDPTFLDSPLHARTQSAPFTSLPASLTVGTTPPHRTTPPMSSPGMALLAPAPLAVYKAYHPLSALVSPPTSALPLPLPLASPVSPFDECRGRPTIFNKLKDVEGMQHYHKRSVSHESPLTEQSMDASRLAMEYRAELPDFGRGYSFRFRG